MRGLRDRQWEPAPDGHERRYSHPRAWPGAQGFMGDVVWGLWGDLPEVDGYTSLSSSSTVIQMEKLRLRRYS